MSPRMPTNAAALMASLSTSECFCGTEAFTESNPPIALPCKHLVHSNCIKNWVESNNANANRCPVCRKILYDDGRPDLAQEQLDWEEELADYQADPRNPLYAGSRGDDTYDRARYAGSYGNNDSRHREERHDGHRNSNRGNNRSSRSYMRASPSSRETANRPRTHAYPEPRSGASLTPRQAANRARTNEARRRLQQAHLNSILNSNLAGNFAQDMRDRSEYSYQRELDRRLPSGSYDRHGARTPHEGYSDSDD